MATVGATTAISGVTGPPIVRAGQGGGTRDALDPQRRVRRRPDPDPAGRSSTGVASAGKYACSCFGPIHVKRLRVTAKFTRENCCLVRLRLFSVENCPGSLIKRGLSIVRK